jgi:hypothetical protein
MDDGTDLAVAVYLPTEGPADGPFPVIFNYHPYHRVEIDLATGEITPPIDQSFVELFTSYGYAFVFAGMRGSGASYGSRVDMSPPLAEDGKVLIDWIADQFWCNGNVGMIGGSYHGWSQFATAGQKPAALKCILPEEIYFDAFTSALFYPGGIYNKGLSDLLTMVFSMRDLNFYMAPAGVLPAAPVVDEDEDGELADEIPWDLNANGNFLDDGSPPTYKDGEERQHVYYNTTLQHLANDPINVWSMDLYYRDAVGAGDYTSPDHGPADYPIGIADSGIAIYNFGGWFDAFPRSTTQWYATMKDSNPSKMLLAPVNHCSPGCLSSRHPGPYLEYFGVDLEVLSSRYINESLRFLDRFLKGIRNGIDLEPPISIYVMKGKGWRYENEWPLARQVRVDYYLDAGNALSKFRGPDGFDEYLVDYTHDSRQDSSGANRWNLGLMDQVMIRNDKDLKCLTYTSQPLEEDTEVTGHPIVHLWASSRAEYGDFFVYLEDVDEEGDAYLITDGQLRAGFEKLLPNEDMLPQGAGIDVLPDLPWHGFNESDYTERVFAGGNEVEVVIDLLPTSWVIKKGHSIRVSIACADWPTFRLHPELCPTNVPTECLSAPTITVYRDANHPSRIELPVIPSRPRVFEGKAWVKTSGAHHWGPAELYTYQKAVYLHFQDRWIKWDTVKYCEKRKFETFKCKGDLGKLTAFVRHKKDDSCVATAMGRKVWFWGTAE